MDDSLYSRPNKPKRVLVRKRSGAPEMAFTELPQAIEIDSATECHVTPPDVAARMVEYLGPVGDFLTLEPSAGTGSLLAALIESGHSVNETVAIERHHGLCKAIRLRFQGCQYIDPMQRCFLEYAEEWAGRGDYPRIIMNPPFKQIRKHMAAALSLLGRGGHNGPTVLVALVPITYQHQDAELVEELPSDTFPSCQVSTKIIRFTL